MAPTATLYGIPGSHAVQAAAQMLGLKGTAYRRVDFTPGVHALAVRVHGFAGRTVPALRIDGRWVQTNRKIARALDELPLPPLIGSSKFTAGRSPLSNAGARAPDCAGVITSQGYNLIERLAGCTVLGDGTGNLTGPARLGPLAGNGGRTETHALLASSRAVDSGSPATPGSGAVACQRSDQRGVSRPADGNRGGILRCDIGAFELAPWPGSRPYP